MKDFDKIKSYLVINFTEFIKVLETETEGWIVETEGEKKLLKELKEACTYDRLDEVFEAMINYGFNFKLSHMVKFMENNSE
jgi:hypothetical protein